MDDQPATITRRMVSRIEDRLHLGPDAQVDDKALLFTPAAPQLTDPFLVLAEDLFSAPGFDWHPHRGLETVTLVLDGVLEHGDNTGHAGTLTAGDVQWMTAGHGIIHRELAFRDERAHVLQLWVNLPAELKMTGTRYQDLLAARRPVITRDGTRVDLISGRVGALTGPARNHWPITGAVIIIVGPATGAAINPARYLGAVFMLQAFGGHVLWSQLPAFLIGEFAGGALGGLAWAAIGRVRADAAVASLAPTDSEPERISGAAS